MTDTIEEWLRRRGAFAAAGVSVLVVWLVWGQLAPVPIIHDEASYLLQADIFASGRWTTPAPPIPEFFEQPHVQVVPRVASKYPPGHALLLSVGALVGFPALVPLLLTAVTAFLLFALAQRVTNPWVALLAWGAWLFSPMVLRFQPSYLSEVTTVPLLLASWWSLMQWRTVRRSRWLFLLAVLVGWGAITRPLTMLVFAIPIGFVVVADVLRERRWRELSAAVAIGVAVLAILPLWSQRTTGSWRESPITKYRLDYLPYDKLQFAPDTTPPRRLAAMSEVQIETYQYFLEARRQQSLRALPRTALQRLYALGTAFFEGARLPLLLCFLAGLFTMSAAVRFAASGALLLFVAHLPYAHWPGWTVYYLETAPVLACVTAMGLWNLATFRLGPRGARAVTVIAAAYVFLAGAAGAARWRGYHLGPEGSQLHRQMAELVPTLPRPGILFVRYSPRITFNPAVVRNTAHPDREPIWIVHDLGERNAELLRLAPGRVSHVLDLDRTVPRR